MSRGRFKPEITRIKLNPEQAVLTCTCYSKGRAYHSTANKAHKNVCQRNGKETDYCKDYDSANAAQS
jgi:hypothetical protein